MTDVIPEVGRSYIAVVAPRRDARMRTPPMLFSLAGKRMRMRAGWVVPRGHKFVAGEIAMVPFDRRETQGIRWIASGDMRDFKDITP